VVVVGGTVVVVVVGGTVVVVVAGNELPGAHRYGGRSQPQLPPSANRPERPGHLQPGPEG
jgi:hypothetical protein